MKIGIDIDNVISNFNDELFREFMKHNKELGFSDEINYGAEYITHGMFNWGDDEVNTFYKNNIERIMRNLNLISGAKEYIDKLKNDGHSIYIITGRNNPDYKNPFGDTEKWLKEKCINYDKLILTNSKINDKDKYCIDNNIDIMIDDSVRVCNNCINSGIVALLMDTPYNKEATDIQRVYNWEEIYSFITNFKKEKVNVILDTDTYNECDDQFALAYMLKSQDVFNVEAITVAPYSKEGIETVKEGLKKSYDEVLKICKWLDFNTSSKVFVGSTDYISKGYNDENDAVNKIIEISLKNEKTYILGIGAITNIALAIKKEPSIINKIEIIWLGGHSLLQDDNLEFNFRQDVEAVKIVLESKVKLTIIPCKNVASNLLTSIYELNHYLKDKSPLCDYLIERFHNDGYHDIKERRRIWDVSVIAYMINKTWFHSKKISTPKINVDTSWKMTEDNNKITMVNYIDVNCVFDDLFKKLSS